MARTAVATLQTVWDCRWSRPGFQLASLGFRDQPEPLWVCTRTGAPREVDEAECETCEHWEMDIRSGPPGK
jgi:hypothetical protein